MNRPEQQESTWEHVKLIIGVFLTFAFATADVLILANQWHV